jgi:short-subunit dehydrogenase
MFVASYYLARFKARFEKLGKRSAVINVSSITVLDLAARLSIYAGTKAFDRIFSLGMQKEYGEYVDVVTVLPMSTKSGMNSGRYLGTVTAA